MRMTNFELFAQPASAELRFLLASAPRQHRRQAVALAVKWEVLAVCVVFVFVGAILFGAF
jgi:hypothetical protein